MEDILYKHIVTEFQIHNNMVLESNGVVPNIMEYVYAFNENAAIPLYDLMAKKNDKVRSGDFDEETFSGVKNKFFTHINIRLTIGIDYKVKYSGGYLPRKSIYTNEIRRPVLEITVTGPNKAEILKALRFVLAHELTHAYDDCNRTLKYGTVLSKMDADAEKNKYYNTVNLKGVANLLDAMCDIINHLSKIELNAYVSQFKVEITERQNEINSIATAYEIAKQTTCWGKYEYLKRSLETLKSITDEDYQTEILSYFNEITENNITSYDKMIKKLNYRFYKWEKTFINRISKIIYETFLMKNQKIV